MVLVSGRVGIGRVGVDGSDGDSGWDLTGGGRDGRDTVGGEDAIVWVDVGRNITISKTGCDRTSGCGCDRWTVVGVIAWV